MSSYERTTGRAALKLPEEADIDHVLARMKGALRKMDYDFPVLGDEQRSLLRSDISYMVFSVNMAEFASRVRRQHRGAAYPQRLRKIRKALERARNAFNDLPLLEYGLACQLERESCYANSPAACQRVQRDPGVKALERSWFLGTFLWLSADSGAARLVLRNGKEASLSDRIEPSEDSEIAIAQARKGIDFLIDRLQAAEDECRAVVVRTKDDGSRQADAYRLAFANCLGAVFLVHFGSRPKLSRDHCWFTFLAAIMTRCDRTRKPLTPSGAYTLWNKADKWGCAHQECLRAMFDLADKQLSRDELSDTFSTRQIGFFLASKKKLNRN